MKNDLSVRSESACVSIHKSHPATGRSRVVRNVILVSILVLLVGCVELKVEPDKSSLSGDAAPEVDALTYNLPKTTITVSGSITLNDCDSIVANAILASKNRMNSENHPAQPSQTLPEDAPPIDITESFTISSSNQADPNYQYRIPFKNLEGWMKQLSLTVARNPNKTLTSINGSITDQTGPTLLAAAQTGIAIGGAIAIPGVGAIAAPAVAAGVAGKQLKEALEVEADVPENQKFLMKNQRDDKIFGLDDLFAAVGPTNEHEKQTLRNVFKKAQTKATQRGAKVQPAKTDFCSDEVHGGLEKIAQQQVVIEEALSKRPAQQGQQAAGNLNGSNNQQPPNPDVTRAQARIASLNAEYHFTLQYSYTWTPTRDQLAQAERGSKVYILKKVIDVYKDFIEPKWIKDDKVVSNVINVAKKPYSSQVLVLQDLKSHIALEIYIAPWTVGRDFGEAPLDGKDNKHSNTVYPNGLIYRDPALSTVRICKDDCGGRILDSEIGVNVETMSIKAKDMDPDNQMTDMSGDLSAPLSVPISQYGRFFIQPLKNVLFQTSAATISTNVDGSIASVGTQSSNAAASGFGAATSAANAQATVRTTVNTAIGNENTALTSSAGFADTYNKALADCLTQQNNALSAGGRPIPCQ